MARIRTIKPEFPQSESMGRCSRDARLLFVNLFTLVDDSGVTRGNSRMLASLLFPYDDDAPKLIEGWLTQLENEHCLDRYIVDGQTYLQIRNWLSHQKIDKPTASKFPQFDSSREDSRIVVLGRDQGEDQGRDQGEEGKGVSATSADKKTSAKKVISPLDTLVDLGVEEQAASDWLRVRKAKRAPFTQTVLDDLKREAGKAGISVGQAVAICARKSWQGFNAGWNWGDAKTSNGGFKTTAEKRADNNNRAVAEFLGEVGTIEGEVIHA